MLNPADQHSTREEVRRFMADHWREPGFTCPNATTYPWLWLWDSCFHAIVWARLGERDRAISELRSALSRQGPNGFVAHLVYFDGFDGHDSFWGADRTSSITQPPIYGHSIAELVRMGVDVPDELVESATRGLQFLLERRVRTGSGLIGIVHPWESGCDNSPRWDDLFVDNDHGTATEEPYARGIDSAVDPLESVDAAKAVDGFDPQRWYRRKGEMVESIIRDEGEPVDSKGFLVGSVAFNALVAFCAFELAEVTADSELKKQAQEVAAVLATRWSGDYRTWTDDGATAAGSARVRTLEALLPVLVEGRPHVVDEVAAQLTEAGEFAGRYGLRQVHPCEPSFDPLGYWRGASWPQLNYLFGVALDRTGHHEHASLLRSASSLGAARSCFSEYWDADSAVGGGAGPQSWSGLPMV